MATASIDGLISGLSTGSMIEQLMAVESRGQTLLRQKAALQQRKVDAFQAVNTKLAAVLKASTAIVEERGLDVAKATSSNATVSATASPGAQPGSLSVSVSSLARAEVHLSDVVTSTDAVMTTGGTVRVGGQDVAVADGRLSSVVSAINARDDLGVRAAAVKVAEGEYRLQLTSTGSGAASAFATEGLAVARAVAGQDAVVTVAGAYDVRSSTNTFTDVVPGLTFTVTKAGEAATLDVARDAAGAAAGVKAVVDAVNATLDEIARLTRYDATSKSGSALTGDPTVRELQQRLLGTVSRVGGLSAVGVETTREGRLSFDAAAFEKAFAADPAVARRLVDGAATVSDATRLSAAATSVDTRAGTYDVQVTAAATRASGTMSVTPGTVLTSNAGQVFTVTGADGRTASYTTVNGDTADTVATRLQQAATGAGLGVTVAREATTNAVRVTSAAHGADARLTLTSAAGTTAHAGTDAVATIGGVAAEADGNVLRVADRDAPSYGLSVTVAAGQTGALGSVTVRDGLARATAVEADRGSDRFDGSVTRAIEGRRRQIRDLDDQIASWDVRLELRRASLQRTFSGLETALGRLQQQSQWLSGQLAGLPTYQ